MNKKITYDINVNLANSGLVIDSFGNASTRTTESSICIKPSGVVLSDITYKDISEVDATKEAKKIENVEKNLRNKKVIKKIFVKNKIINFIIT